MLIGVPTEIKADEYRVSLTPAGVREALAAGQQVIVQSGAGARIGFSDEQYRGAGATLAADAAEVFERAELIVKVKEPQPGELRMLRRGQVLFTYLHLAPAPDLTAALLGSGATAFAYETVTDAQGGLPLLAPMSEMAGRMAAQVGPRCLEIVNGGSGVLLGGVAGVAPGKALVLGGGVVGTHAARMLIGLGADVTVVDRSLARLTRLEESYGPAMKTVFATADAIEALLVDADLVIGAVLVPGAQAPKLIPRRLLSKMRPGAAIVDVAVDQGGCTETSRPTTHSAPMFVVDGIVHYCVANMPGALARTATSALTHATLPFVLQLARLGWRRAAAQNPHLADGLNVHEGQLFCAPVAEAQGRPLARRSDLLAG